MIIIEKKKWQILCYFWISTRGQNIQLLIGWHLFMTFMTKKLLTDVNRLFWCGYLWERKSPYKQILKFKGHFQFYINLQIIIFLLGFLCFWPRAFMRKVLKSALLFLLGVANFFYFSSYIVIICQDFVLFRQESIVRMENTFL